VATSCGRERGTTIAAVSILHLQTLVDRLNALDQACPPAAIEAVLGDGVLDEAELQRYVGVRSDKYARRLVHRSGRFDVMVLTWAPGQATPVHNHAGNFGWVRLVRGQIAEDTFRLQPGATVSDAAVAANAKGRVGGVGLVATGSAVISAVGAVAAVDRERAIHRLGNPAAAGGDATVTLHVYSLPHDACLAFDVASRTCERRELVFDPLPR
jgi:predicted metal-dependent enzyme (double-stranded beta helix superfamily)